MDEQELQGVMEERMLGYRFLSQVYRSAPTVDFLRALKTAKPSEEDALSSFVAGLQDADLEALKVDLGAEYVRVLLNMGPSPVAPYESVYTSPEKLLMQDARDEVVAAYRREGLAATTDTTEPEDHLATEFEFMAYLCEKALLAAQEGKREMAAHYVAAQKDFFTQHIVPWVPLFCDDFDKQVKTKYYKALSNLTRQHIAMDEDFLKNAAL
ncbi:MAG: molecular chaperone TorD family protein [Raoultibacter sp.]